MSFSHLRDYRFTFVQHQTPLVIAANRKKKVDLGRFTCFFRWPPTDARPGKEASTMMRTRVASTSFCSFSVVFLLSFSVSSSLSVSSSHLIYPLPSSSSSSSPPLLLLPLPPERSQYHPSTSEQEQPRPVILFPISVLHLNNEDSQLLLALQTLDAR